MLREFVGCEHCAVLVVTWLVFVSRDVSALDKEVQDMTAVNDADSGLQMAVSPCSLSSMTCAAFKHSQHSGELAVTGPAICGHSGTQ